MSPQPSSQMAGHRLLPVDWIAFGIGVVAVSLAGIVGGALSLAALAVFLPPALRETGLLKDGDEFTRDVMRRAGFHGLLALVGLFLLHHLAVRLGVAFSDRTPAFMGTADGQSIIVGVFLVSYLLQYWGARLGTFRILLGAAALALSQMIVARTAAGGKAQVEFALTGSVLALALIFTVLALLVRRRPRLGGWVLVGLFAATTVAFLGLANGSPWNESPPLGERLQAGLIGTLKVWLLFGCTGWALLRTTGAGEEGVS